MTSTMGFPIFIHVGAWRLHPHLVFELLAYSVGFRLYLWLRRRRGDHVTAHMRWSVVAAAIVGAAVGSRALYWLEDPWATFHHWNDPVFLMSGKTIVGGLVGGTIAVELVKARLGITRATGDLFALPLAVGIAIGRIGCFLTGLDDHTYGVATTMPWGVDFGDGIARHPTALYELLFLVVVAVALHRLSTAGFKSGFISGLASRSSVRLQPNHSGFEVPCSQPLVEGALFKIFIISYLAFRLAIDALKPEVPIVLGLSAIQLVCLLTLTSYSRTLWKARRRITCKGDPK